MTLGAILDMMPAGHLTIQKSDSFQKAFLVARACLDRGFLVAIVDTSLVISSDVFEGDYLTLIKKRAIAN